MVVFLLLALLVALKLTGVIAMGWLGIIFAAFTALILVPLILFVAGATLLAPFACVAAFANRHTF